MNRTIKFRGKRIDNGQWVYGWLLGDKQPFIVSNFTVDMSTRSDMKCPNLTISDVYEVDPDTVGRFTGLLDRSGHKIYEGDILKGKSYLYGYQLRNNKQFEYFGFVKWEYQCDVGLCYVLECNGYCYELKQLVHRNEIDYCTGEVVGNIHDNPDLVKGDNS